MEKMLSVKGESLRKIREYYQVTLADVFERTKIKEEKLREFESGEDFPSYPQLEKLAEFYNKPVFYFFNDDSTCVSNEVEIAFRKIEHRYGEDFTKQTIELMEKADAYRANLSELYEDENSIVFSDKVDGCNTNESLICRLRELLSLSLEVQSKFSKPEDFLEYLRNEFYNLGVYVFKDSFKNDGISGLCLYDDIFPVILLNNKTSFKRQIFTLLHEVYHLYLKEADIDYTYGEEEAECNKFASEFLIPSDDLSKQLERIDDIEELEELDRLAKRYNVSRDAIMYRLVKNGLLDVGFYKNNSVGFFREPNASAGGNFYFTKMSYLGAPYLSKVFSSYYSGKLSKFQVGMYTGLKSMHVSKLASKMMGGAL